MNGFDFYLDVTDLTPEFHKRFTFYIFKTVSYNRRLLALIDLSSKKLKSDENSEILIFNAEVVKTTIFEAKSSLLL